MLILYFENSTFWRHHKLVASGQYCACDRPVSSSGLKLHHFTESLNTTKGRICSLIFVHIFRKLSTFKDIVH